MLNDKLTASLATLWALRPELSTDEVQALDRFLAELSAIDQGQRIADERAQLLAERAAERAARDAAEAARKAAYAPVAAANAYVQQVKREIEDARERFRTSVPCDTRWSLLAARKTEELERAKRRAADALAAYRAHVDGR